MLGALLLATSVTGIQNISAVTEIYPSTFNMIIHMHSILFILQLDFTVFKDLKYLVRNFSRRKSFLVKLNSIQYLFNFSPESRWG